MPRTSWRAATCASTATSVAVRSASSVTRSDEALASGARRIVLDNTYLTRALAEPRDRERRPARCRRFGASGSTRRSPRLRSISSSACSTGSARCPTPRSSRSIARASRGSCPDQADARLPRARTPIARRGIRLGGADRVRAYAIEHAVEGERNAGGRVRRRCGAERDPGWERALRVGAARRASPAVRLETGATADVLDDGR